MKTIPSRMAASKELLPAAALARLASISFSLCVLTLLLSLAASQIFLSIAGVLYFAHLLRDKPSIVFPPIKLPLALFCLLTILSLVESANPGAGGFAVRKLTLFMIILLTANLIVTPEHLERLYQGIFIESAFVGLIAAGQFIKQLHAVQLLHPHHLYRYMVSTRIHGLMGDWMNFGGQQMLIFAALAAFLLLRPRVRKIWWLVMAVVVLSIVLNFTRGVWLASFFAGIYLLARWRARWLWGIPILIAVGYLAAPRMVRERVWMALHPMKDPALSIRFQMWRVGLRMMEKHPWLGVGPNAIYQQYPLYLAPGHTPLVGYHSHLHDNFIQIGAERGLPCLAAWVWMMGALGWAYWKMRRRVHSRRWIVDAAFAGWMALLIEGCFEFNFGTSPVLMVFLFVASTPFAAGIAPEPQGESSPGQSAS